MLNILSFYNLLKTFELFIISKLSLIFYLENKFKVEKLTTFDHLLKVKIQLKVRYRPQIILLKDSFI